MVATVKGTKLSSLETCGCQQIQQCRIVLVIGVMISGYEIAIAILCF